MKEQRKANTIALLVSYLLVLSTAIRGVVYYPDVRLQLIPVLGALMIAVVVERLIPQKHIGWRTVMLFVHLALMVVLFLVVPYSDFWAIIMLPACVIVMQVHQEKTGWIIIAVFALTMSVMQVYIEGFADGLATSVMYLAAFVFVGLYSLLLKRRDDLLLKLETAHRKLESYASRVEELTSVRERNRIARDLHDSVTQTIFSMSLLTKSIQMTFALDPDDTKKQLEKLETLSQSALTEMRNLIQELRPKEFPEFNLTKAISNHADEILGANEFDIELDAPDKFAQIDDETKLQIFNIVREALNNVVKHAKARSVRIQIKENEAGIQASIYDDGIGFTLGQAGDLPGHMGLSNMRERAKEIGGDLNVDSKPRKGTEVVLIIPTQNEKANE